MYTPQFAPYKHQIEANARMRGQEFFALLMAMRTGKTKTLLDDFGYTNDEGNVSDLSVIAPGGVFRTWEPDARKHLDKGLLERMAIHTWDGGKTVREATALREFLATTKPRAFFINVEALSGVQRARDFIIEFLSQRRSMLGVDESTIIKNQNSKRSDFVIDNLKSIANYRRILSGLLAPRSPLDVYNQMTFLSERILGFSSFYTFRNRFAIIQKMDMGGPKPAIVVVGYRDPEELRARIAPHSFRVRLEDCYDMPPKVYMWREVEMTDEQKRIYKELKLFATAKLDKTYVTATIVIAQILKLHQVLMGHVKDEAGNEVLIPENRTKELITMLDDYEGKAIIWCSYDIDIQKVYKAIEKEFGLGSCARFWGGNKNTREAEEKRFKEEPTCRFMVATQSAGGRGRTWDVASLVVYYSSTNDLEHRLQSEERPISIQKNKPVAYVDMVIRNTVEDKIIAALRKKLNMSSIINGDNYQQWLI